MHIKFSSLNDLLCTAPIVYGKILAGFAHNLADARPNVFFLNKAFAFPADTGKKAIFWAPHPHGPNRKPKMSRTHTIKAAVVQAFFLSRGYLPCPATFGLPPFARKFRRVGNSSPRRSPVRVRSPAGQGGDSRISPRYL